MDWLTEFANSRIAKRIVFANYISHLRQRNEGRHTYSSIEEALEDFAQRVGLTDLQKRGLRRQTFVKIALVPGAPFQSQVHSDQELFETDNAPATILPGVRPGSELARRLEETKKKKNIFKKLKDADEQKVNRDVEDRTQDEAYGTNDDQQVADVTSTFSPGLVIEAAEETSPWEQFQKEEKPSPMFKFKEEGKPRGRRPGKGTTSKEKSLLRQMQEVQNQLVRLHMEPGGSIARPKWKKDLSIEQRKGKIDLQSKLRELQYDLATHRYERREKEEVKAPGERANRNTSQFLGVVDKVLGIKTDEDRRKALRKLSPEGLQDLYEGTISDFRKKLYYRPSQGYSDELGDYVKCMVCDKEGRTWINKDNPGMLPTWHLDREHADDLLGEPSGSMIERYHGAPENYRRELVDAYLRKYPGAALQSREHELATFIENLAEKASDSPLVHPPHVATESEKDLNRTDEVMLDMIMYQFDKFGVDPDKRTVRELAQETLDAIKSRLNEEFPDALVKTEYTEEGSVTTIGDIGKVQDKGIPFEALQRAFREEVGEEINEYRGTFSDFRPPARRQKRRWTKEEREQARQKRFKQLRREDVVNNLAMKLERSPTQEEIEEEIRRLDLVPVNISVTGGRACWNCGEQNTVLVDRKKIAINSATCPNCGVYREVLVETKVDDPESGWDGLYVIRDTNENDPGGVKWYIIYENDDYINGGSRAIGNSKFVRRLARAEQEIRTDVVDEATEVPGEQYVAPLSSRDRVYNDQYGNGTTAFVEGAHIWVAFDENPQAVRLEDLEGEVVNIGARDPNRAGYWKVENIVIDRETETVEVIMRSESGRLGTRHFDNLAALNQQVPVATEMSLKDLQKVTLGASRLRRKRFLLRLAQGKNMIVKVERYVKTDEEETPQRFKFKQSNFRLDWLRGRVRRSRTLQHLFNIKWSCV